MMCFITDKSRKNVLKDEIENHNGNRMPNIKATLKRSRNNSVSIAKTGHN